MSTDEWSQSRVLCCSSVQQYVLSFPKRRGGLNVFQHMVIDIIRTEEGLVLDRDIGPVAFFSDVSQWSFVYKNMLYMLQTLVGDGVVVGAIPSYLICISSDARDEDLSVLRGVAIVVDRHLPRYLVVLGRK